MKWFSHICRFKCSFSNIGVVWIWYEKLEKLSICRLLQTVHLKRYRGFGSKANAWKIFEELSSLKDERLNRCNVPQVPNVTRWFGQLSMLKTFQKVERGMKLHIANSSAMKPLSVIDWRNCQGYIDIHLFFISSQFLQCNKN